jgi:beta-lactam-binding protein with PASTA domain
VRFQVRVENKANAPSHLAFDGSDTDGECRFSFAPAGVEVKPGETQKTTMTVRPPKQIWIGRPRERRIEVRASTDAEAVAAAEAEDELLEDAALEDDDGGGARRGLLGQAKKSVRGPKVSGPRIGKPNLSVGPGGVKVRQPQVRGPRVQGPRLQQRNFRLDQLKMPSRGAGAPPPSGPLLPTQAVFRQKPWLPWWLAIVIPLLLLLLLLLLLFLPKNVEVPDVVGKKSAFEAEKSITEAKLRLAPQTKEKVDAKVPPGTVLSQTPPAGDKAEENSEVAILVAVGTGKVTVPDLTGQTPTEAEKAVREEALTRGQATPQPVDPKAEIKSQIPAANEIVKEGAPVDIFTVVPGKKGGGGAAVAGGDGGDEGEQGSEGGGEGARPIVPEIAGAKQDEYAQKVGDQGLVPKIRRVFDESEAGTVFRTDPEEKTEVEAGSNVRVFVSAGFPQVAYDNGKDVLLLNGANGKPLEPVAKGPQDEDDPAWSPDGGAIAYTGDGVVFLLDREQPDEPARALSAEGRIYSDLAWAPTTDANVLAMIRKSDAGSDLCFGAIDAEGMETRCIEEPEITIDRKVNWAPDGKSILAFGGDPAARTFGMVRWTTEKPFSSNPADWSKGELVTDASKPDEGVLDAVIAPDGKRMAVVNLGANGRPELFIAKRGDFLLADAKRLGVRACKVIWRPDGVEVVVVQADDCLGSDTGDLVRLPVADPKAQDQLKLGGDNPVFQPLAVE